MVRKARRDGRGWDWGDGIGGEVDGMRIIFEGGEGLVVHRMDSLDEGNRDGWMEDWR